MCAPIGSGGGMPRRGVDTAKEMHLTELEMIVVDRSLPLVEHTACVTLSVS
jgi:hypothetical protein